MPKTEIIADTADAASDPNEAHSAGGGWHHLTLPGFRKAMMVFFALLMAGLIFRALYVAPENSRGLLAISIPGFLFACLMNLVAFRPSLRWNDECIEYLGPFCRAMVTIRWPEIERHSYMKRGKTFWFKTQSGRKVQLSTELIGLRAFIADLKRLSNSRRCASVARKRWHRWLR